MGSEIFRLKSFYLDDTIVRGARNNLKNAKETKTVLVNPGDAPVIKTGETGVNAEYVIQSALTANDLKGYGTFTNNSDVVQGYTGPQNISHGDIIRLDVDTSFYTVTGMQGTNVYLVEKYVKPSTDTPSVQSGPATLRKTKLGSVKYEYAKNTGDNKNIYYDKDRTDWGITGMQVTGPQTATSESSQLDTGVSIEFQSGTSAKKADLMTIGSVYKTLVDNNTSPITDASLSPLPFPHDSLKVFIGASEGQVAQKTEFEDYVVNYSRSPELKIPRPPYEERDGAYIKFLDKITDESQIEAIDSSFEGNLSITKKSVQAETTLRTPIKDIIPSDTFSLKVGGVEKRANFEYVPNYAAGLMTFVKHRNSEYLIDTVSYIKRLMWDGISVIRGVREDQVKDMGNLVIPPMTGLSGVTGMVYYEDTDENNLLRDVDYILDPESGAISLTEPLKDSDSVLVSYYVEGEDVSNEEILLDDMMVNKYPVIVNSVTITQKYKVTENGNEVTKTRVLIEGQDFSISYITGRVSILNLSANEEILSLQANYTPMAQIHCILQGLPGETIRYRMTIINDLVKVINPDDLIFEVSNNVVSIPQQKIFKDEITDANYDFEGPIIAGSLLWIKDEAGVISYDVSNYGYTDVDKQIKLDGTLNADKTKPDPEENIVASYSFESETLPYAPALMLDVVFNEGDSSFVIEGFDRTDVLKHGMTIRVDNFDPENTYYFKIKDVVYRNQNTVVYLYGYFPELVINPTFYLFDDDVTWKSLPSDSAVDATAAINSEAILIEGGVLTIKQEIQKESLLMINDQQIYRVTSVTSSGDQVTIGIFPSLQHAISGTVRYSSLPVRSEGDTVVPPKYFVMLDAPQPAFTLSYEPPTGFEGSAKILVDSEKILITESIQGIKNPQPYEYQIADYPSVYALAKGIQGTASTFRTNVPWANVPDYNPFTIFPAGSVDEQYYLGSGIWSTDLIIPFEEDTAVDLPYTFNIVPELYKWSLIQAYAYKNSFLIRKADKISMFNDGNLLAFRNKIDGKYNYFEVSGARVIDGIVEGTQDTEVSLKSAFTTNLLNPSLYKIDTASWVVNEDAINSIDYDNSKIIFNGSPQNALRPGNFFRIADRFIYRVDSIVQGTDTYTIELSPEIDSTITMETYYGYVKQSATPLYLNEPGPQPYLDVSYTVPVGHVGKAKIRIDSDKLTLKEILDNFYVKETELRFDEYASIESFLNALSNVESYATGYAPYTVSVPEAYLESFSHDKFESYKMVRTGAYTDVPYRVTMAAAAFEVRYMAPSGYSAESEVKILSNEIVLRETVHGFNLGQDSIKEVRLNYSDSRSLKQLAQSSIPAITSLVSSSIHPYSCTLLNTDLFDEGFWSVTRVTSFSEDFQPLPEKVLGVVNSSYWYALGALNEVRLEQGTDYEIETGAIVLTDAVAPLDRFRFNYMGLWSLPEFEGESILCTCRFFTALPTGSRLDVYMDYLNIDQFYLQKLTERKFTEIVVAPQIQELIDQKGSGGGQSSDNGANNNSVPTYQGGVSNLYYALRDEQIKKQLYQRFYEWYKDRLRNFAAELQLTMGFKFGHSNALGLNNNQYTLADDYVENEDYTLTSNEDIAQINNGFSKFFPVGYEGQAPKYYERFGREYRMYSDAYCCNIQYRKNGTIITEAIVKSDNPYWNKDLNFMVWSDSYINKNLVGSYQVDVPAADRTIDANVYTFLRRIDVGDKVKASQFQKYYEIKQIQSPSGKTYEYLVLKNTFSEKGIKTYILDDNNADLELRTDAGDKISFDSLMDALPPDGYQMYVQRSAKEDFPMSDDYGNLGASAYGDSIEGLVQNSRRIKKPFLKALLALLFPLASAALEPHKNFKIWAKKDSEGDWEPLGEIDLKKLTFKEERNADDVLDALRYDFTKKFIVPIVPPVTVYDIEEDDEKGFHRYFYLSMERIYDAESPGGYYDGFVLRAKNKEWWFKITNGDGMDIIQDYGFSELNIYKNFYDPDNIYKKMLLEKQAWETESLILKDLFDYNDKLARAFKDGDLNRTNSVYQGHLAKPNGGTKNGISDILKQRIPAYEKQLLFLINKQGPVNQVLYPDLVHPEDSASAAITTSFNQTAQAWDTYNGAYQKMVFFRNLNNLNNLTWRNDYVRWALSLQPGILYQKDAKEMYESDVGMVTFGLREAQALKISLFSNSTYTFESAVAAVRSDGYGRILVLTYTIVSSSNPSIRFENLNTTFVLYKRVTMNAITSTVYKTLNEVCLDVAAFRFNSTQLFSCSNIFEHYENNVVEKMLAVSGLVIDPTQGAILHVCTVADHRVSDPRVLFLGRSIEDRVYLHNDRELPGFTVKYLGDYYKKSADSKAIIVSAPPAIGGGVELSSGGFVELSSGVFKNDSFKKIYVIKGTRFRSDSQYLSDVEETHTFELFDAQNSRYLTLQQLVDSINTYRVGGSAIFRATLQYSESPYGDLSSEYMSLSPGFIEATRSISSLKCQLYVHVSTGLDSIPTDINQGIYRIFYDTDFHKKLEIKFTEVIVDGSVILTNTNETSDSFVFDFQKSDGTFKTLDEFVADLNAFRYRQEPLFEAEVVYQESPNGSLPSSYVVLVTSDRFLGFDQEDNIYVDTYTVDIMDPASARSVVNATNAYFAFPMYTSNGNPSKIPIEGIPVSGQWGTTLNEQVMEIQCLDGNGWEVTFSDYESGAYKDYKPTQEIIDKIDSNGYITEDEYETIGTVQDRPQVSLIKELVLIRKGNDGDDQLALSLRNYDTINELVTAINEARFDENGTMSPTGQRRFFSANLLGDPAVQGEYKSYELHAEYLPIIRSFAVVSEVLGETVTVYKYNHLVGWQITVLSLKLSQKASLSMSAKRYSPGDMYTFIMDAPEIAYENALTNFPQGFRRDTLAFDLYSWDDDAIYEIKDNWIYFKSAHVDYAVSADLGQPDKTLGYGIPLAGSGHQTVAWNESIGALIDRINNNAIIKKFFFASLKFTRSDSANPGFFEYDYLPDYRAEIPKSVLDDVTLRDDLVITLRAGTGYTFTTSSYTVDDISNTIDLSCDWTFNYEYSEYFDFDGISFNSVTELVNEINARLAPQIGSSIFEAQVVGAHGGDSTNSLLADSGPIAEVSETFTANTLTDELSVGRTDWFVNDVVRFTTTGVLPSPLIAGMDYYVVSKTGTGSNIKLKVSASFGGAAVNITSLGTGVHTIRRRFVNLYVNPLSVTQSAMQLRVRNSSGTNFTIVNPRFSIPSTQGSLQLTCTIVYNDVFSVSGIDFSSMTFGDLSSYISSIPGYPEAIFNTLFNSQLTNEQYRYFEATRLYWTPSRAITTGTSLQAHMDDIVALRLLNANPQANIQITTTAMQVVSFKTYSVNLPTDKDIHGWVDTIRGNFKTGMLSTDVVPIKVDGIIYGLPNTLPQTQLEPDNKPAHVFFGILGDIRWVQISDYELRTQYNYVKERLGMPWKNDSGIVQPDYYTPEQYNVGNPYAIDLDNFLGYMKSVRYNQIENSVINEALTQNKYFWLYMKFHKEFGCDQRVKALTKQIADQENDSEILSELG